MPWYDDWAEPLRQARKTPINISRNTRKRFGYGKITTWLNSLSGFTRWR